MAINDVSCNQDDLPAQVIHAAYCFRAILISLLMLPAAAGAPSGLRAQTNAGAEPSLALITFADGRLDNVCVGESVGFSVIAISRANPAQRVNEVLVLGEVQDMTYGTLDVGYGRTWALQNPAGSAPFRFKALRPGTTEIHFSGLGSGMSGDAFNNVETKLLTREVRIFACDSRIPPAVGNGGRGGTPATAKNGKPDVNTTRISKIKVTTRSTWSVGMDIVATIDDGVMVADKEGHFTGSAMVKWWTSMIGSAGCGAAEYTIPPSKADLSGEIDDSNQLVVTITFEARDFSGFATCGPSRSTGNVATPAALTVSVPQSGGTSTQDHEVTAKNGSFAGSATIVVTPERK